MLKKLSATMLLTLSISIGAQAEDITVSAAASLTNAFKEIAQAFERQYPEHRVYLNFAGSGALLQQIAKGAPVDLFASADQKTMNQASAQHLIVEQSRKNFVKNTLVLIVPNDSHQAMHKLSDLTAQNIARIAISNPASVPVGNYSKEVLEKEQLWHRLKDKIIRTENVRQSLDYVARGEVDAGFVYATDAALMSNKVRVQMTVPTTEAILYPAALTQSGAKKLAARAFLAFLSSEQSKILFAQYGFSVPE